MSVITSGSEIIVWHWLKASKLTAMFGIWGKMLWL